MLHVSCADLCLSAKSVARRLVANVLDKNLYVVFAHVLQGKAIKVTSFYTFA
jgi:hypothetical protein